jgi:hypothetical protein
LIRSDLRAYLLADDGIADLVGTRIYPVVLPQGASRPAITYARISGGHSHNIDRATGSAIPTFEIDCWGDTFDEVDELAEALRQAMQGFGPGTFGSTAVKACLLDDETDAYEWPEDGSDKGIYRITLRYRIRYTETVPTF